MKRKYLFFLTQIMSIWLLAQPISLKAQTFPNPGIDISPLISVSTAIETHLEDLDGDGDLDVIVAFSSQFGWYENLDGLGNYGPIQTIDPLTGFSYDLHTADLDNDGDMDIIKISNGSSTIYWYENTNSLGAFGPPQTIITMEYGTRSLFTADIDGDNDLDLLTASFLNNRIAWYENTNGQGTFGPQQIIITGSNSFYDVYAEDIDNDGDMDVLSASFDDDRIAWYENTDGLGNFGPQQTISIVADGAAKVFAVDMDGDQDPDVLSASFADNKIAWYENTNGLGAFGAQQIIPLTSGFTLRDIFPVDIDGDGDIDVVSASHGSTNSLVAWHENLHCDGTFASQETIADNVYTWGARIVTSGDIDLDGDMDVVVAHGAGSHISWHENTTPLVPQINLTELYYVCDLNFEEFCGPPSTVCNNLTFNWYYIDPNTQTPIPVTNSNPNSQCYTPDQYGSYSLVVENANGTITNYSIEVVEELPQPIIGLQGEICEGEIISIAGQGFDIGPYEITWFHNATMVQQGGTTLLGQYTSGTVSVEIFHIDCNVSTSTSVVIKDCCPDVIPDPILGTNGEICVGDNISIMGQGFDNGNYEITWLHNGTMVQQGGTTLLGQFTDGTITVEVSHIHCDEVLSSSANLIECCPYFTTIPTLGTEGKICIGEIISIAGQGYDNGSFEFTWLHNGNIVQQGGTTLTTSFTSGIITVEISHPDCHQILSVSVQIIECCPDNIQQPILGSEGEICIGEIISIAGQGFGNGNFEITWLHNGNIVQEGGTTLTSSFTDGIITVQVSYRGCEPITTSVSLKECCPENMQLEIDCENQTIFISNFPTNLAGAGISSWTFNGDHIPGQQLFSPTFNADQGDGVYGVSILFELANGEQCEFSGSIEFLESNCCEELGLTAVASVINSSEIIVLDTLYGPIETAVVDCELIIDGSLSTCEDSYHITIEPYNPINWTSNGSPIYDEWFSGQASNYISIPNGTFPTSSQGEFYLVTFAVGPTWTPTYIPIWYRCAEAKRSATTQGLNDETAIIFPNPATDALHLKTSFDSGLYQMHDIHGKLINQGTLESMNTYIDLTRFNSGVYFLQILSPKGQIHFKKVIKE